MFKRLGVLVLAFAFILAILPVSFASADTIQSWVIVDYRVSPDGTNWSSRYEMQLVDNAYFQFADQRYIKIDRIRVLDTTNHPSDLYLSFSINIHPYIFSGVTSSSTYDGTQNHNWNSTQTFDGYFRSRSNEFYYPAPVDYLGPGRSVFCVGQYHLPDTTGSTAFTLTPDSDIYFGYTYSSSTAKGIAISVSNVNCVFVGNDSQLYDINSNLTTLKAFLNQWYTAWNTYFQDFESFLTWTYQTLFPFFQGWHSTWSSTFLPHFDNIWQIMTQTNYTYLSFAGNGAGLTSAVVKNPLLAINGQLSALVRYFNKIQKNDYSYDSISYDSDGIGTSTVVSNVPWFDAMLGQLKGSSAIEQHHMEMENEALEAGANDVYQGALSQAGTSWGVLDEISGIYQIGDPQIIPVGYQDALTAGLNWYSVENRNILVAPETPGDPDMRFSIFDLDRNRSITFGGDNSDPG